jgi:hypothetical protein
VFALQVWDMMAGGVRDTKGAAGPEVRFGVQVRNDSRERTPPLVRLKAVCGPGDQGEPVITANGVGED